MSDRRLSGITVLTFLLSACASEPTGSGVNTAPVVSLVSPIAATTFSGGDVLAIAVTGTDAQDGALTGSRLEWWVVFHHATHTHPFLSVTSGANGTAPLPRVGHLDTDIFYRVYARAVDRGGLADTVFVDVLPRLVTMSFATVPPGLQVRVDGQPRTTPVGIPSVQGMDWALSVDSPQVAGGFNYYFGGWSQGGAVTQTYRAPSSNVTLTATFTVGNPANVPPTVTVSSPTSGAILTAGTAVTVSANAADADGTVTGVQFFEGANSLGTDNSAPFSVQWTPTGTGPRTLTARATDDALATTTSAGVSVTVQPAGGGDVTAPSATLTAPTQGTLNLTGSVSITATASDNVGVTLVEFAVDGESVGTDATAPYAATLAATNVYTTGAHTFRVRARDAAGNYSPWSSASVTFGGNVTLPAGFTRTTFATISNSFFAAAAFAPDGRLFVLDLLGAVRVIRNGVPLATPFVTIPVLSGGERGLLGIAFDPNFATNNFVYLYYTTAVGGAHNRISRFTANGDVALAGSELILVELEALSAASNHNGGALAFGPDGKLYVAVGDNANGALAPSLTSRFGKMLRYNTDGTIPSDNPLVGSTTGVYQAIWARGLRNPYTFAFQLGTGRMHINDVGQGAWEEINLGVPGANYGWPSTEGATTNPNFVSPLIAYGHFNSPTLFNGFAIVGGAFYNPPVNLFGAAYSGDYFFADYVNGWIYRMDVENGNVAYAFAQTGNVVTNLLVGPDGALYFLFGERVERIGR